jgi:hypothetical protein
MVPLDGILFPLYVTSVCFQLALPVFRIFGETPLAILGEILTHFIVIAVSIAAVFTITGPANPLFSAIGPHMGVIEAAASRTDKFARISCAQVVAGQRILSRGDNAKVRKIGA